MRLYIAVKCRKISVYDPYKQTTPLPASQPAPESATIYIYILVKSRKISIYDTILTIGPPTPDTPPIENQTMHSS